MADANKTPDQPTTEAEAPKKPQAVIKMVEMPLNEEFTEPEGWVIREIHSVDVAEGKFFALLVKVLDYPRPAGVREGKAVDLKD